MYALHVLDTRQLADFIREGQSQNESLSGLFSDCRFCDFCCFLLLFAGFGFVVVAVATALVELVLLNRPACLLGCLVVCCCCFPCFPRVLRLVTLGALQTLTSQPVCFYTPPCVSTSVPFDCESSANRAYIPVKLILHGHKRFVARF